MSNIKRHLVIYYLVVLIIIAIGGVGLGLLLLK